MKKTIMLVITALFLVSAIGMVSAVTTQGYNTLIAGKIYDSPNFETAGAVADATVHVTCNGIENTSISKSDGTYFVSFGPSAGCFNTDATAWAEKNGVNSDVMSAHVQDYTAEFDLYLGVINIALIPEFGLFVAGLTIVSAIAIFFLVRKK